MVKTWLQKALIDHNPAARGARSDYDLNGDAHGEIEGDQPLRAAAVLVPIVERVEGATVLLTKRTDNLAKHAGQISFPGGSVDMSDDSHVAAALRETHEEIGLDETFIQVHGSLDTYRTGTGFEISPFVATVRPGFQLNIAEEEVAEVFEVPLAFFLNRANHQRQSAVWRGQKRHYYAMPYNDHFIWGATAAMLVNLIDVLEAVQEDA